MDRLSAYAAREAETRSPEDKAKAEEEATVRLMEQVKISKPSKAPEAKQDDATGDSEEANGTEAVPVASSTDDTQTPQVNGDHKVKGIPDNIKLFEIFHEQVMNVISAQRLPIQDITALLVSLANLAL